MRLPVQSLLLSTLLALGACTAAEEEAPVAPRISQPWKSGVKLLAEDQIPGDPEVGRHVLLNGDYMTCGVPVALWNDPVLGNAAKKQLTASLGGSVDAPPLPDRDGFNAELPYFLNAFTAPNGADVINANCLACHGGFFNGELMIGLGNSSADFTRIDSMSDIPLKGDELAALLAGTDLTQPEIDNMMKLMSRGEALQMANMRTVGNNPAEMFAVLLAAHHDQQTLEWSTEPLVPIEVFDHKGKLIDDPIVTSKVSPWWRVGKKNALFHNGMARGDHRGTMALATSVCVDDVERAREVDRLFRDIQAYVKTITAPTYPFAIDAELAEKGKEIYTADCAGCHGTYGATDAQDTYPNLLIPLSIIGTDPVVAEAGVVHAPTMVEWYNASFYGQVTRMAPNEPWPGYMAPPLDGVWATAPFLHNGSVPTIELVLNSKKRPKYWKRVDYDTTNFDEDALGWPWVATPYSQAKAPDNEKKHIYDTTYWSQSNRGHTFGDHLSNSERRAVIEYLKTL